MTLTFFFFLCVLSFGFVVVFCGFLWCYVLFLVFRIDPGGFAV